VFVNFERNEKPFAITVTWHERLKKTREQEKDHKRKEGRQSKLA
jgi:hypothetical protein